jgi:hypothetical protein
MILLVILVIVTMIMQDDTTDRVILQDNPGDLTDDPEV